MSIIIYYGPSDNRLNDELSISLRGNENICINSRRINDKIIIKKLIETLKREYITTTSNNEYTIKYKYRDFLKLLDYRLKNSFNSGLTKQMINDYNNPTSQFLDINLSKLNETPDLSFLNPLDDSVLNSDPQSKLQSEILSIPKHFTVIPTEDIDMDDVYTYHKLSDPLNNQKVDYVSQNDFIYIIVDNQQNSLKMIERIFQQKHIYLNTCKSNAEFYHLIEKIYLDYNQKNQLNNLYSNKRIIKPKIMAIFDHILDREYGYQGIKRILDDNRFFSLYISFYLLSTSEDNITRKLYSNLPLTDYVVKPLNLDKLNGMIKKFDIIKNEGINYNCDNNDISNDDADDDMFSYDV